MDIFNEEVSILVVLLIWFITQKGITNVGENGVDEGCKNVRKKKRILLNY